MSVDCAGPYAYAQIAITSENQCVSSCIPSNGQTPRILLQGCNRQTVLKQKKTTHFYKLDRFGEIRVLFVIRDDARAHSPSGDLNVDARLIDSGQLDPLQVSQTPEQDLQTTLGLEMESICSSFYANEMRCKLKAKIKLVK